MNKNEPKTCVWVKASTHKRLKKIAVDKGLKIQSIADDGLVKHADVLEGKAKYGR